MAAVEVRLSEAHAALERERGLRSSKLEESEGAVAKAREEVGGRAGGAGGPAVAGRGGALLTTSTPAAVIHQQRGSAVCSC